MPDSEKKSTFITAVAWVFIVLGGFATFITFLQNIMLFFFFPREEMKQQINNPEFADQTPAFFQYMFSYFEIFFLLALVISFTAFISAIGLLKRQNWARIVFITLMALGIIWNLAGVILQFTIFPSMQEMAGQAQQEHFQTMQNIIMVASIIMALVFSALFGWIIKRLVSEQTVEEFA